MEKREASPGRVSLLRQEAGQHPGSWPRSAAASDTVRIFLLRSGHSEAIPHSPATSGSALWTHRRDRKLASPSRCCKHLPAMRCEAARECSGSPPCWARKGLWCPRPRTPLGNPPPDKLQTDGRGEGMHGGRRPLVYWLSGIYPNPHFSLVLSLLCHCCEASVSIHLFYPIQDTALGGGKPSVLQITVFMQTAGWIYAFN